MGCVVIATIACGTTVKLRPALRRNSRSKTSGNDPPSISSTRNPSVAPRSIPSVSASSNGIARGGNHVRGKRASLLSSPKSSNIRRTTRSHARRCSSTPTRARRRVSVAFRAPEPRLAPRNALDGVGSRACKGCGRNPRRSQSPRVSSAARVGGEPTHAPHPPPHVIDAKSASHVHLAWVTDATRASTLKHEPTVGSVSIGITLCHSPGGT